MMDGKTELTLNVVIPTYRPDDKFERLMSGLIRQTCPPKKIILMNTEKSLFSYEDMLSVWQQQSKGCTEIEIHHIEQKDFDHAATRRKGLEYADADVVLFMTEDAIPVDERLTESLLDVLRKQPDVAVAYARQMPGRDCTWAEREARRFNYPAKSRKKTAADLDELGIRTFFCSDVCAAYRKERFLELGGFPDHAIFNEDMVYASKVIHSGDAVYYCADAKVIHSHNYTGLQQFHRNFDLGVSHREFREVFDAYPAEGTGIRMVMGQSKTMLSRLDFIGLVRLWYVSGCKYVGYRLGKMYDRLPKKLVLACTTNPGYFESHIRPNR